MISAGKRCPAKLGQAAGAVIPPDYPVVGRSGKLAAGQVDDAVAAPYWAPTWPIVSRTLVNSNSAAIDIADCQPQKAPPTMFDRLSKILEDVRSRLAEPQRAYHGQAHIDAMLAQLRADRRAFHAPEAVELAIWFHDAVYEPGAADNERKSAALLRRVLDGVAASAVMDIAEALILATEHHAVPPGLPDLLAADLAAFLDLDMAILGAPPAEYDRYAKGVAREFVPVVGEVAYRQGRAAFLRRALASGTPLFHTTRVREMLEFPAQANMLRELGSLD